MATTFIGNKLSQSSRALELWEHILLHTELKRIVEFGTYKWGMTLLFYLFCVQKKMEFFTFDSGKFSPFRVIRVLGVTKHFRKADIFSIEQEIGNIIKRNGTTLVYCDNGDKPRELKTFTKYLKKGDYIAVHDWGTEINRADVPEGLIEVFTDECDREGMTRIFQYA